MCTKNINHIKCSHFQWDLIHIHIDNVIFRQCSNVQNKFINCKMSPSLRWFPFWGCTKVLSFFPRPLTIYISKQSEHRYFLHSKNMQLCRTEEMFSLCENKHHISLHFENTNVYYFAQILETFCMFMAWILSR